MPIKLTNQLYKLFVQKIKEYFKIMELNLRNLWKLIIE